MPANAPRKNMNRRMSGLTPISLCICLVSFILCCACRSWDGNSTVGNSIHSAAVGPLVVSIEIPQLIKLGDPLNVNWKVSNLGGKTEYLYSSLIEKPDFVETSINTSD